MPNTSLTDYRALGLAAAAAANTELVVDDGDIVDMLLAAMSGMADYCDQRRAADHLRSSVDGSKGADLTELADDHFSVTRQTTTAATVTVAFSRIAATAGAGTISAGFEIATPADRVGGQVRFATATDAVFSGAALGPISVQAVAIYTGPEGNVEALGRVSQLVDTAFDASITVANTSVAAGGNDAESDSEVRRRIRDRPISTQKATRAALQTGALEVPEIRVATATEAVATGNVSVAVSDADGNSNAEMMNDALLELESWRALGIPVTIIGGARVLVNMTVALTLTNDAALDGLKSPVAVAIAGAIDKLSQGKTLYDTLSMSAAKNVAPDLIEDVTITALSMGGTPVAIDDYTPATNELLRAGTITVVGA